MRICRLVVCPGAASMFVRGKGGGLRCYFDHIGLKGARFRPCICVIILLVIGVHESVKTHLTIYSAYTHLGYHL